MAGLGALQGLLLTVQRLPGERQRLLVGRQRQPGRGHFGDQAGARRTLVLALASQFCSASFFRLRMRPNRSSSQLLKPTCTASDSVTWLTPISLLASLTRERVTLPLASTDGSSAARWMRYCARSFSTCSTATRRSRFSAVPAR